MIAFAGTIPPKMFDDLPKFLNNNLSDIEKTCKVAFEFIKNYLSHTEIIVDVSYWRLRVIVGSMEKGFPQIATIVFDTRDLINSGYSLKNQEQYGFTVEFIGNTANTFDLQEKFINNNTNKNRNLPFLEVEKYAREYLREAVRRYPDKCNNNFVFEPLY